MNPRLWGFAAWVYLFSIARWLDRHKQIPGKQKKRWASLVGFVLPCLTCEVHYLYVFKTKYDAHKYNHHLYDWLRYVYYRVKKLQKNPIANGIKKTGVKPWKVPQTTENVNRAFMIFVYSMAFSYDAANKIKSQLPDKIAHYAMFVRMFLQSNFGLMPNAFFLKARPSTWSSERSLLMTLHRHFHINPQQEHELRRYFLSNDTSSVRRPDWMKLSLR